MTAEWPLQSVSELQEAGILHVEDGNHGEYRPRPSEFQAQGTPFIRAADIDWSGRILFESASKISDTAVERVRKGKARPGDILFSHKGTVGKLAVAPADAPPFVCSPQTTFWRTLDTKKLHRGFLYAFMRSRGFRDQWFARKGETDMADYVSLTAQRTFVVPIPPIDEQRDIANVLGVIDDRLKANRKLSETLEATCQAIFRSWFVDFDPVVAKSEGRNPPHLSEDVAALFPSKLVDTDDGPIPEGWSLAPLPECFEINPTRRLRRGDVAPYLDMKNMPTHSALPEEWSTRGFGSGLRFMNGDTLVARITPCLENGKTAFVRFLPDDVVGWGSTEYIVLRSKPPLPLEYSYFLARTEDFRGHSIANMTGSSGRQRVPTTCYEHYLMPVPEQAVAEQFGIIAHTAIERMHANILESRTLAALRDALLPRLLSGELRVRQAEKLVEEAI